MKNPPNFVVWIILARNPGELQFMPLRDGTDDSTRVQAFSHRKDADVVCRGLRKIVGKGNCYVQQYGPYS